MERRSDRFAMRARPADKKHWEKVAKAHGLSLSAWVESRLNTAAIREEALDDLDE